MAGGSNGYRAAVVRRQHTLVLISSLPGTAGLPPFTFFSTSCNSPIATLYAWELDGKGISLPEAAEWVAMERWCCPFLTLQLEAVGSDLNYWMKLTGPDGAKAFLV